MRRAPPPLHPHVRGLLASPAIATSERLDALRARGVDVFKLALGQSPFPVPARMVEALRSSAGEKDYLPVKGLPALRRAIAEHVERRAGVDRTEEDVLVGPGTKELLFLLQITFDGDIVVPTPSWVSHAPQGRLLGREVITVEARREDAYVVRASQIDATLSALPPRPRVLVLNYPNNPTGLTHRPEELREIARVAERHNLVLVSDEIYGELHHKGQHASIARYYPDGTVIATGLSKWVGAGGWRLGALVFPEELRPLLDAMAVVASETYTSTSAPVQHAGVVAFNGGDDIDAYLVGVRRVLAAVGRWTARRLVAAGLSCAQPVGAFYVFCDFEPVRERLAGRGITTSVALCDRLLEETGVALLPGAAFGRPASELCARLAYVDFDGARALSAVSVIPREQPLDETFLRRHAPRILEATERIIQWSQASGPIARR